MRQRDLVDDEIDDVANRWANLVAAVVMTLVQTATLFLGTPTPYYAFFSVLEIGCPPPSRGKHGPGGCRNPPPWWPSSDGRLTCVTRVRRDQIRTLRGPKVHRTRRHRIHGGVYVRVSADSGEPPVVGGRTAFRYL